MNTVRSVEAHRSHCDSGELYTEIALSEDAVVDLFENGTAIVRRGDASIILDDIEAMHLANAILARSQQSAHYERVAKILESEA